VQAANGGMADVELGKLELTKASDPQPKSFCVMMVKHHPMANTDSKERAKNKRIYLPDSISSE
jgi:putative membrane protein